MVALLIHVGSHPDELVGELCRELASVPADPFSSELVAAPTRGIERWLTQRIASGSAGRASSDGVCANVEFPSPRRLVREVLLAVPETAAAIDAWEGVALTRTVVSVVDEHLREPWMWLLRRFIEAGAGAGPLDSSQRLRAARKIAGLFIRYARRRPEMVRSWREGRDLGPGDRALPEPDTWQPRLWRLVRERIGAPGLAEQLPAALEPVRRGEVDLRLPDRVFVYGLTAVDPVDLEVFEAVATGRDVHIYVLHPSPALWRETASVLPGRRPAVAPARTEDPASHLPRHPLLRSWAQESRELQLVLAGRNGTVRTSAPEFGKEGSPTLLRALQQDIRSNTPPAGPAVPVAGVGLERDRSVQMHACYGATRQVEVLRDAILHVLAADCTLEPRDVVIMTPDLATFAPLLEAVFLREAGGDGSDRMAGGGGEGEDTDRLPDLRLRIADRTPVATNPLVCFAATVLDLARSRLEGGTIRELVAMPVVRRLFGLDEETVDRIAVLIEDTNVRWGLDGGHHAQWNAGAAGRHTWRRGLDRALAGVFYGDSRVQVIETVAPMDGIEGEEARLAGLLAQIIDRIAAIREMLGRSRPHSEWGPAIAAAVRLLAAPAWEDQWQWSRLERLLEESFPAGDGASDDPLLGPAEALLVVNDWARDVPSPLHFRTGDITVCTLVPMRSVPYRVVCLLGMDDERFPRSSRVDGDDLLVDDERVGDPDRGAEDRQLLLDAVMAAGDHLIITYSGRDELTNAALPPAVPVAELRDLLREMVAESGWERIETRHPLQAFSEINFRSGGLGTAGPWGFDPMQFAGSEAVHRRGAPVDDIAGVHPDDLMELSHWSPWRTEGGPSVPIPLEDLRLFLEHPARGFIRTRLGFTIPPRWEISDDTLPTRLDALDQWKVTDRLLAGLLDGYPIEQLVAHEVASDTLPPGRLGRAGLEIARTRAVDLWRSARRVQYDPARHEQFTGAVAVGNRVVEGSITAQPGTSRVGVVTPSRLKGKQRLRTFLRMVFLTALYPVLPWHGLLIGRHLQGDKLWTVRIGPIPGDATQRRREANRLLADLVALYVEGMDNPLPLPCETAFTWQRKVAGDRRAARRLAGQVWETDRFAPESKDPANEFLFPHLATMAGLEWSSFPDNAERLWKPILPMLREKQAEPFEEIRRSAEAGVPHHLWRARRDRGRGTDRAAAVPDGPPGESGGSR